MRRVLAGVRPANHAEEHVFCFVLHAVRICVGLFFRNLNSPLRRVLVGTHVDIAKYLLVRAAGGLGDAPQYLSDTNQWVPPSRHEAGA